MIHIENLVKRYGNLVALNHLNLNIHEGEIFGLLGPNGSGKTTAINCLLSLLKYDKGTIEVFGQPMTPESYQVKQQIGIVLQNVAVFDELTVYENIDYFCGLYVSDKKRRKELVNEAIQFVGLEDYCKTRPGKLSGGLLRRLNIACGIAHKPRLIIMDEPTVAVDPQSRNKILEGIQKLNEQGSTIIYTSHYMEEVEQMALRFFHPVKRHPAAGFETSPAFCRTHTCALLYNRIALRVCDLPLHVIIRTRTLADIERVCSVLAHCIRFERFIHNFAI